MVQKYQSPVRIYKYPFELVMAAYEKRFPTCKMIPVFLGSDVMSEFKSEDGAVHEIERRCKLNVDCPYLVKKIVGVDHMIFIQKNCLDRRARTLKIDAHNESFASRVIINESCFYFVHEENPNWTCFEQSASLDVKSFFGLESTIEKIAIKQYSHNIQKGKEVIEFYINELLSEGVTHIPVFVDPCPAVVPPAITVSCASGTLPETVHKGSPEEPAFFAPLTVVDAAGSLNGGGNVAAAGGVGGAGGGGLVRGSSFGRRKLGSAIAQESVPGGEFGNFKLDADYIERCLGSLTPLQESRLVQLRKWVAEAHKGKVPPDSTLLRFLRARDFNVEKSREILCQSLVWRKKYQLERILSTYTPPSVVKDYFPGGWYHSDRDGRPLYLLRVGQMDVKGLLKAVGEEGLLKLTLHICEEGLAKTEEATKKKGVPISTWTCLVDLEGLNMRHLWRPGIRTLLRIIEIVEANYPETMGRVLIVRAPRVFPILWTIISTFIDERTRQKLLLYSGSSDYMGPGGLGDYMDEELIPDFLGGPCQTNIPEGGLVPKSLYMPEEEFERERSEDNPLCERTIYNCVSLGKGQVHEVLIQNRDKGSVICWDFDVIKQDVAFTILRTKNPLSADPVDTASATPPSSTHNCGHLALGGHPLSPDSSHVSYLDKNWREGVEYIKVEMTLVCHDGESIQGSHVTSHEGSYVLQWKFDEPHHGHHTFDIIESITIQKAKVMYYYEVLKSQDYRVHVESSVLPERILRVKHRDDGQLGQFLPFQMKSHNLMDEEDYNSFLEKQICSTIREHLLDFRCPR